MTNTTNTTTDALNGYEGDNIWQDVIMGLADYDGAATDEIDEGANDRFIAGGVEYRWNPTAFGGGAWEAR